MTEHDFVDKKALSERDICTKFITPAIRDVSGWNDLQFFEEFTLGKIHVRGKRVGRGVRDRADYILFYKKHLPLAIIEAKDNNHEVGAGMQQALRYSEMLDIPFAYSSNGDGFIEHDRTKTGGILERALDIHEFPSPQELWERYKAWKQIGPEEEKIVTQPYFIGDKPPRYYQQVAINRTVEAIAKGQNRILLVMATGTGKTYTAFQIMWRLWKAKKKKRILFLADRNILVDQARLNDFKHFGDVMTKVSDRTVDKSFEVYLALYQAVSGTEEEMNIYKQFSRDFFDLIFVDECHRGSAAADSAWRQILEYFEPATQIGLTATPRETVSISNIEYFSEPLYTYSLKQGIEDGFLAPYKVIRIELDRDIEGWRPRLGQRDAYGYEIPDDVYYGTDFDKSLVIEERTQLVAHLVTEHLKSTNRMNKTIVFCRDIPHAEEMRRALINENGDLFSQNRKYIDLLFQKPEHIAPLRQSILELAVRGKLTRREPSDDSATELLERIYQEKLEEFPPIKESEISFEVPKEWKYLRLGELAKFVDYRGHTPPKTESGLRLITAKNVRMGRLNVEPREYVDPAIYETWMTRGIPRKGDLLFTTEAPMGNVCLLDTDEKALFAQRLITFKVYGNVNSKFAMFALMSQPLQRQILDKSSGVAARGIKAKLLKTVLMPLPPLAEQERIVKRVEQLLSLCDALEAQLRSAQEERGRLVKSVLAGVGN